jgi:hypothetical protein
MKRHPALQLLSDDHHRALVLARRLRKFPDPAGSTEIESLAREVRLTFEGDLEPHFQVEEEWLLPRLVEKGAAGLAEQVAHDHARLRQRVLGVWVAGTAAEVGSLLERHVRFEERVVFPEAESLLLEAELENLREARARRGVTKEPVSSRIG